MVETCRNEQIIHITVSLRFTDIYLLLIYPSIRLCVLRCILVIHSQKKRYKSCHWGGLYLKSPFWYLKRYILVPKVYILESNRYKSVPFAKVQHQRQFYLYCTGIPSASQKSYVGPNDFRDAENTDRILESSHKNGIYSLTRNVTKFVKVWMN